MLFDKSQEINGVDVHYKVVGQGPAVLVLHGWGRGSVSYVEVMEALAQQRYQVITPDLPGFGKTPPPKTPWGVDEYAQFAFQFAQKLTLGKFYLLGHSFGGQIAVKLATEHPELVQKLILYGAAVLRREPGSKIKAMQAVARMGNSVLSIPPFSILKRPMRKAFYRLFGLGSAAYSQGIMKEIRGKIVRQDLSHLLPGISLPVLILWGDKDRSTPLGDAYLIKGKIPHASLVVFRGATHLIHREMPEEFVYHVAKFCSEKQ